MDFFKKAAVNMILFTELEDREDGKEEEGEFLKSDGKIITTLKVLPMYMV